MTQDLHSLMAPYALDALEPFERSRFEAHLDQCVDCQAELAGFIDTAARLGDTASHAPPPALRDRILAAAAATPQERPVVTAIAQRSRLRRTLPRLAVAAAFLVGAVGVGGYVIEHEEANDIRAEQDTMTSVIAASDAETKSLDLGDGNVRMIMSAEQDAAVVIAKGLPAPEDGNVYQVWMIDDQGPTSQGTFTTSDSMMMSGITGADTVAITVEPKGGSDQPTSDPVAAIDV